MDQVNAWIIDDLRADVRHAAAAELRHPVEKHRSVRIAGGHNAGVGNLEGSLYGPNIEDLGLRERHLMTQGKVRGATRPELMAMGAIHVQVGASSFVETHGWVMGIG